MSRGKFFVIDGTDGSGKATQTRLLIERMWDEGFSVQDVSFPRYETPTGKLIRQYLLGTFGDPTKIDPHFASGLYAADRLAAAQDIEIRLHKGMHVIADRYVAANMGHQGSKIADLQARCDYYQWNEHYEYVTNGIPRPDLNIILHLPSEIAMKRIEARGNVKDGHETLAHIQAAERTYLEIAQRFPGFMMVECVENGRELNENEIHALVWAIILSQLQTADPETKRNLR